MNPNPRLNLSRNNTMNSRTLGLNGPLPVFRLSGKVAIITGGAGRIGVEAARRLLREGANVSLVDIDPEGLKAAVNVLGSVLSTGEYAQSRILTVVADVTLEKDVETYTKRTIAAFGRLDCVFLGAGIPFAADGAKSILETTEEEYERIMPLNIKSG
jgi:NAD(P)-dependent dehydrogenase (short-subunit alcohol dehydrogenase family)